MRVEIVDKEIFSKMLAHSQGITLSASISGITIDSRLFERGDMFIPIVGERVDGHEFIPNLLNKKPSLIITEKPIDTDSCTVLKVDNSMQFIASMAKEWRKQLDCKFIGITGSNGKTTTKEMVWHILSDKLNCFKSEGNYNTILSAPLSLLSMSNKHDAAIVEIGTNQPGEIEYISKIVKPDIGLITNVSHAHTEFFDSVDSIIMEKAELLKSLSESGTALVNTDYFSKGQISTKAEILTFGFKGSPDFKGIQIDEHTISVNNHRIQLPFSGVAAAQNSLAAFTISKFMGLSGNEISNRISSFKAPTGRGEVFKVRNFTIIDDSYNANPSSMKAGLNRLSNWNSNKKVAVLGDMYELGKNEIQFHSELGKIIQTLDIHTVLLVGKRMKSVFNELKDTVVNSHWFSTKNELTMYIKQHINESAVLFFKGSRGMQMEKIIEDLK